MRSELSKEEFRNRGGEREQQRQGSHLEGVFITPSWVHWLELRHRRHLTAGKQSTCQDV